MAVYTIPNTITASASVFVQQQIAEWLESLPNGASFDDPTIARLGANQIYGQDQRIAVSEKSNFIIDGNGSQLRSVHVNDNSLNPNLLLHNCSTFRVHNLRCYGNFHLIGDDTQNPTTTRNQGRVNNEAAVGGAINQFSGGIGIFAGSDYWITNCRAEHVFGDGVLSGLGDAVSPLHPWEGYIQQMYTYNTPGDPSSGHNTALTPRRIYVYDWFAEKCARHGISFNEVDVARVDGFQLLDSWYFGIDCEADAYTVTAQRHVRDVQFTNGDIFQYAMGAITFPVPAYQQGVRDLVIRGVKCRGELTNKANGTIQFEARGYNDDLNPNFIHNATVEHCAITRYGGPAVQVGNLDGGLFQNNRDINLGGGTDPFYINRAEVNSTRAINITLNNNTSTTTVQDPVSVTRVAAPPIAGEGSVVTVPANTTAPAITGSAVVGQRLTCLTGTWTQSPASYAYQWRRNGANISGATSANYVVQSADVGATITCLVTATNSVGSTSATSNSVSPAAAPEPEPEPEPAPEPSEPGVVTPTPTRPSLELTVIVTDAEGRTKTLDSHAPDPADRPRGIQFGSQLGSGFYTGSFTLSRAIDAEHIDLHLGDDVRIVLANGDTVYEGWISGLPRSLDTEHSLTVNLSGYMAHTADEPFSFIFADRDLSRWGGVAVGRHAQLLAANYTQPATPSVAPDATTGRAALVLQHADEWAAPMKPIAEAWYDAGPGNAVSTIYYDAINVGHALTAVTDWDLYVRTSATDDFAAINASSGDQWGSVPIAGYLVDPDPVRYGVLSFYSNTAGGGASGNVYSVQMRDLAVFGNPDLIVKDTTDYPLGVTASGVIRYLIGRYCPHLNTDGVMDTTYPIGHLVFDESTVYDALLKVNSFHMLDLACWEDRTIHYRQIDLTSWDWELRHDEVGNQIGLQGDSFENLRNGVIVKFTDVATGRQERLHPDDHAELRDESIDNPANVHGRRLYGQPFVVPFPTTAANALELGRLKLAEDLQVKAPGSFTVTGAIRDRSGQLQPPSMVRSGDRVRLTSSATLSDRPRLVHECQYAHDGQSVTISVDSTRTVIEALLDRTVTALQAANIGT